MKQLLASEDMITILLATVENITSVCSAMGRTKGLCDTASQLKIFVMDIDAFNTITRMGILGVDEPHMKGCCFLMCL